MKEGPLNIVFFPHSANFGLAGTNRLQNIIYYLKKDNVDSIYNIALEDRSKLFSKNEDQFINEYKEVYYGPSPILFFKHLFQTPWHLLKAKKNKSRNVIFFYGEVDIKNFFFVLWARLIGYKVVIDVVEDLDAHTKFRSFKNMLKYRSAVFFRKRLNWFADGFTAVSSHLSNKFESKFPKTPLFFLPVTINKYLMNENSTLPLNKSLKVFYSGSFNEKDGLPFLLDSLHRLKKENQEFKLILSGKGTEKEMQSFWLDVEKFDLKEQVDYRGFLDRPAYIKILTGEADVLCMTRINSAYANAGFPFKLGEFLSTGKPVIASKVGDIGKYLTPADAYLVDPENPEQIKEALLEIIKNRALAAEVGLSGKKVAMTYFDHEHYAPGLKDFMAQKIWA